MHGTPKKKSKPIPVTDIVRSFLWNTATTTTTTDDNQLTGTLPTQYGNLIKLKELEIREYIVLVVYNMWASSSFLYLVVVFALLLLIGWLVVYGAHKISHENV
jgi:hypothetical protein